MNTAERWAPSDFAVRQRIRRAVGESMCVEAGAGTGKTTVLVDRIVEILRTGHASVNELVAITFTEKAAAELSARVRQGLEAVHTATTDAEERKRLEAALRGSSAAHIETIHAFAASLLRERPIEARLDPGFEVLDELPRQLSFETAWNEWVTEEMAHEPPPPALVDVLNVGLEWRLVREAALRLHNHRDVLPLAPYAIAPTDVDGLIVSMREALAAFEQKWVHNCRNDDNVTLCEMRRMGELHRQIIALHSRGEPALPLIAEVTLPNTQGGRAEDWPRKSPEPKKLLNAIKSELAVARSRIKQAATAKLLEWLAGFVTYYTEKRKTEGTADFDDLLLWARDLVRDNDEVRAYYQAKYKCVLVDEFQDTDPLQAEMIVRLCAEMDPGINWRSATLRPGSLFAVGDPKQSIYRFRRADITMYDDVKRSVFGGEVEEITQNFRSAKPVIDWVNGAFSQLITADPGVQPHYIALEHHPDYVHGDVTIVTGEAPKEHGQRAKDTRIAEAKAIASLIQQEVEAGSWRVRDLRTGELRAAEYRDVAVLIPSRTELTIYEEQLLLAGIAYRHEGGRTFFQRQEVRELVSILRALDDPGDQVAVISALRSPAFACSDEELFLHKEHWTFDYLSLRNEAAGVVADSLRALRSMARRRHDRMLPEYVREVIDTFRLVEFTMLQHQGEQAASNLLKIIDQARAFSEAKRGGGLRGFVRWLKDNIARTSDETDAAITEETDDAVRIVTIHMSKGLEFGVVVFANMSVEKNDWTNVIVTRELAGGRFHVRLGRKESGFCTPGYEAAALDERAHTQAEQLRLLYVAATRARDHLVVPFFHWEGDAGNPRKGVAERRCLNDHFRSIGADEAEGAVEAATLRWIGGEVPSVRCSDEVTSEDNLRTIIEGREEWHARRQSMLDQGSGGLRVHTATSLKGEAQNADGEQTVRRGRAREFGIAVHAMLERIDLEDSGVVDEQARAIAKEFGLLGREDEIAACARNAMASECVRRALTSSRMLREVAFTAPLPGAHDHGLAEGRIDLLFVEDGEIVVVDFKTDDVAVDGVEARMNFYRTQALVYAWASRVATGLAVREVVFLFARLPDERSFLVDDKFLAEAEGVLQGPSAA